jgi:hypothetical protein
MCYSPRVRCLHEPEIVEQKYGLILWITQHVSSNTDRQKVMLPSDGHISYCISPLLFKSRVSNNITIICLPNQCTHTLQPLNNALF